MLCPSIAATGMPSCLQVLDFSQQMLRASEIFCNWNMEESWPRNTLSPLSLESCGSKSLKKCTAMSKWWHWAAYTKKCTMPQPRNKEFSERKASSDLENFHIFLSTLSYDAALPWLNFAVQRHVYLWGHNAWIQYYSSVKFGFFSPNKRIEGKGSSRKGGGFLKEEEDQQ